MSLFVCQLLERIWSICVSFAVHYLSCVLRKFIEIERELWNIFLLKRCFFLWTSLYPAPASLYAVKPVRVKACCYNSSSHLAIPALIQKKLLHTEGLRLAIYYYLPSHRRLISKRHYKMYPGISANQITFSLNRSRLPLEKGKFQHGYIQK